MAYVEVTKQRKFDQMWSRNTESAGIQRYSKMEQEHVIRVLPEKDGVVSDGRPPGSECRGPQFDKVAF